ncbi:MAG: glutaredoxin 3 [Pseudomonadota bacterium]
MAKVIMYYKNGCPYCVRANALFVEKGAKVEIIEAETNPEIRAQMRELSGRNTFPQIFIGGKHIGGCDDLFALDHKGGLDPLLAA